MTTHLIWSNEGRLWWRANGAGYTSSIWDERLGRFTADYAASRVSPNIRTSDGRGPKDVVVPAPELDAETFTLPEIRTLPGRLEQRAREVVRAAGGCDRAVIDENWLPLRAALSPDRLAELGEWMWMSWSRHGDRVIEAYKHSETRGYLNLDQDGQAWQIGRVGPLECDPWCDEDHGHVKSREVVAEPMDLADALKWAGL